MTDNGGPDASQFKYEEMSNKVTRADRRLFDDPGTRADRQITSNPESVVGRVSAKDMGTRARAAPQEIKAVEMNVRGDTVQDNGRSKAASMRNNNPRNISELEVLNYVPTTAENQQIYELLSTWSSLQMEGDVSHDIVRSLTDMILEVLKNDDLSDIKKQKATEDLLDHKITSETFQEALELSKRITDYGLHEEGNGVNVGTDEGIAVVFEEEEEEDDIDIIGQQDDIDQNEAEITVESEQIEDSENLNGADRRIVLSSATAEPVTNFRTTSIRDIDQYYLRRFIADTLDSSDSVKNSQLADQLMSFIKDTIEQNLTKRHLENVISEFFEFDHSEAVEIIVSNYIKIYYGTKLRSDIGDEGKLEIFNEMKRNGHQDLVDEFILGTQESSATKRAHEQEMEDGNDEKSVTKKLKLEAQATRQPRIVDLDALVFDEGSHLRTSTSLKLPKGAYKIPKKHEEIHIPAPEPPKFEKDEKLIPISELPTWAQVAFPSAETSTLNRIQSRVYPVAFNSEKNILMCAPTGAGKTNVAMLTILQLLSRYRNESTNDIDLAAFKVVYIAPLKALVQEQVREFGRRLSPFGITVSELTGDSNLTKHQIASTEVLVTTPEKWDVITRKSSDISYVNLVRLVIIDEVHLLHDERGPVLESIVARTHRGIDKNDIDPVRLVGLSATLPNYHDVANFLRVDEDGLFYFDSSYRPCPLAQQFIGINEKRALRRYQAMNEVCCEKILENVSNGHQVIVFVHSRKETFKTAKWIRDKLLETDELHKLVKSDSASVEILKSEAAGCRDTGLKDLLPTGFAIHHAGMNREDRSRAEDLFAEGYVQVLVCTATLAWGVNLPAHTVIIKGTNVYSPEKGTWVELSPQDILQMLGRAGRPRYDKSGEGIIITSQEEVQYYLAILNQQLPIESQFMSKLVDNLNAEIVLGSVISLEDAIEWLYNTYFVVRMSASPALYHVGAEYEGDIDLKFKRMDLCHSAMMILQKHKLVSYDQSTGTVTATELGKIASHYYISYESMDLYNHQLKSYSSLLEILRIFAASGEFKYIPVRQEEKQEVSKLLENAPIPIRESEDDPLAKVNILLQAYISRLRLDGFALMADMVYITQSAGRLLRALHEIALRKGWALTSRLTLDLCKMTERRIWLPNSPFRQFPNVPLEIIRKTESSHMPWKHYFQITDSAEMSAVIRSEKYAKTAFDLLQSFPKLSIIADCQPITPSLLRVSLEVIPEWVWDESAHGFAESFILLVEDCDGEKILYHDTLLVRKSYINTSHFVDFTVPVSETLPPNYFVSLISDKWLHCESKVPLVLTNIKPLKKFPAPTALLNLQPIPVTDLKQREFEECFSFTHFNRLQTQVFQSLYHTNDNILIGSSKGWGKTVCAELAFMNHWRQELGRAVYISPHQEIIDTNLKIWRTKFSDISGGKEINKLTGELTIDLQLLLNSHLILATPEQFDTVSRRWISRKSVQSIELFVADDCHTIGEGFAGCTYEVIIGRMRLISLQLEKSIRVVALGTSLANGRDFGEWIGANKNNVVNLSAQERISPVEVNIQGSAIRHNPSMVLAMIKPAFHLTKELSYTDQTAIVFVPSRRQCVDIVSDFLKYAGTEGVDFLKADESSMVTYLKKVKDASLREALANGVGFFYKQMVQSDRNIVEKLYAANALTVLFVTRECCYFCPQANMVVVLSTQFFEGKEHRYIDYSINEVLEMVGAVSNNGDMNTVHIFTNDTKREYYEKFISESLPIESHLNVFLHDALINEITNKTVTSRQSCVDWLTYFYFYRRLQLNPSFYGLKDTTAFGLSEYLSDLIEITLGELEGAKLIEVTEAPDEEGEAEEDVVEISPLNGAMIAAYYNVSFTTMQTFMASLTSKVKLKGLLEIISAASEFEEIPIRQHEQSALVKIYNRLPIKTANADFESPQFKTFVLLQSHFARMNLPPDLEFDRNFVLTHVIRLLYAIIDILSTEGYLNAVSAMDLSQMIVQAVWDSDGPLKQIPYVDEAVLKRAEKLNVETVFDIMSLEDEERDQLLSMSSQQMNKVAEFVNKYPNVDISYELDLSDPLHANEDRPIIIEMTRDEEMDDATVVAPFYPIKKEESWWVAVGEQSSRQLYAIKKVKISQLTQQIELNLSIPNPGLHKLSVWCICDSYTDADKEVQFDVMVAEEEEVA